MFAVPDALAGFYLICFLLGLVFVLVSALMGASHDIAHLPGMPHGHFGDVVPHAGHTGDMGAHAGHGHLGDAGHGHAGEAGHGAEDGRGSSRTAVSPLNLMTIMAFLTWFGAAGYILHAIYHVFIPISLLGGAAAGILGGAIVFLFLIKVLLPGTAAPNPRDYEVVGSVAEVTIPIQPSGVGEVVYVLGGTRHSDGARSANGLPIPRGTEVVIVRYEKGIAYVQDWNDFLAEGGSQGRSLGG